MMKYIKLLLIFLFLFAHLLSQSSNKDLPLFRNFNWGVTPEEVKINETAKYLQTFSGFNSYALSFRGEFLKLNSRIDFSFKDSMLTEGSYLIKSDLSYKENFVSIREHFNKLYGKPKYWAIRKFGDTPQWIRETDFGTFRGPELFWEFKNGFIAIQSSKFIEEITITVLYVYNQKINEYGSADVFNIKY